MCILEAADAEAKFKIDKNVHLVKEIEADKYGRVLNSFLYKKRQAFPRVKNYKHGTGHKADCKCLGDYKLKALKCAIGG